MNNESPKPPGIVDTIIQSEGIPTSIKTTHNQNNTIIGILGLSIQAWQNPMDDTTTTEGTDEYAKFQRQASLMTGRKLPGIQYNSDSN